jgi:hypothetical protein
LLRYDTIAKSCIWDKKKRCTNKKLLENDIKERVPVLKQDNHFFNPSFITLYNTAASRILLLHFSFSSNKQIVLREGDGKMANLKTAKDNFEVSILSLAN